MREIEAKPEPKPEMVVKIPTCSVGKVKLGIASPDGSVEFGSSIPRKLWDKIESEVMAQAGLRRKLGGGIHPLNPVVGMSLNALAEQMKDDPQAMQGLKRESPSEIMAVMDLVSKDVADSIEEATHSGEGLMKQCTENQDTPEKLLITIQRGMTAGRLYNRNRLEDVEAGLVGFAKIDKIRKREDIFELFALFSNLLIVMRVYDGVVHNGYEVEWADLGITEERILRILAHMAENNPEMTRHVQIERFLTGKMLLKLAGVALVILVVVGSIVGTLVGAVL